MYNRGTGTGIIKIQNFLFLWLLFSLSVHASFIESTLGTAVVNDATATYYNPAALTLLKNSQMIALGSVASSSTRFTGEAIQSATGFIQSGSSTTQTQYFLPSFYLATPTTHAFTFGFAVVSNFFNKSAEEHSILRYAQSSNSTRDIDLVPALGFKLNDYFSLGAGVSFSHANLLLEPTSGFPSLNIPDAQSNNAAKGNGLGGDIGFLLKPGRSTLIGFNYRSSVTYQLRGRSVFEENPPVISNNYNFAFWTPARSVLSINQFVTPSLGFIGTVQYIQWNIINEINIHGIATKIGSQPVIANASVPFHLHNSWLFTVGTHYRLTPKWVIRVAGNYNQSPGDGNYQISSGDSIIAGASIGYELSKNMVIDGSFAHAFIQNQPIHIMGGRNVINGENKVSRDAFSLKLTLNR